LAFPWIRPYFKTDIQWGAAKLSTIDLRVGRYVLIDPVGRGAMGVVYRAEDPLIHRVVAVKVLHATQGMAPHQIQIARERFTREAQTAGSIDHPNIIRIFDVGEEAESADMYIVMEYLSGPSLERMLHDDAAIPLDRAVQIVGQIASGLDAAHARGIIHRDIKPSNILFTEMGTPKLADFGITQVAWSSLTQDMRALGTPAYTSPEQVSGKGLDPRADLFSLGVVTYEILTGRKPFEGADGLSIAYAIVHARPDPVSEANPQLPRALDGVLDRILAKDPAKRFASGREFHEALLSCLTEGSTAHSPTRAEPSRRRRYLLWGLVGVAILATVIGLTLSNGRPSIPDPPKPAPQAVSKVAAPVRAPVPKSSVSVSLTHRLRSGTLVVSLDGKPFFSERFSKSKLALMQTTTWDPFEAPAGSHKLSARVLGDNGKTYLSDPQSVELIRARRTGIRIGFKGDKLTLTPTTG
jgi:serine/threonine protein kinase